MIILWLYNDFVHTENSATTDFWQCLFIWHEILDYTYSSRHVVGTPQNGVSAPCKTYTIPSRHKNLQKPSMPQTEWELAATVHALASILKWSVMIAEISTR
jgi:hypothetical protein